MYRPPIGTGRDAIGSAIGAGLQRAAASVSQGAEQGRRRQEDERRRAEEQRRYEEQQRQAERARALALAQMGGEVVDPADAYEQVAISLSSPQQGGLAVPGRQVQMPGVRRRREGVRRVGDQYVRFDPRSAPGYQAQQAAQEDARTAEQQEISRRAAAIRAIDPNISEGDAIARAMGVSATGYLTNEEAEAARRRELEYQNQLAVRRQAATRQRQPRVGAPEAYHDYIQSAVMSGLSPQDAMNMAVRTDNEMRSTALALTPEQRASVASRAAGSVAQRQRSEQALSVARRLVLEAESEEDIEDIVYSLAEAEGMTLPQARKELGVPEPLGY